MKIRLMSFFKVVLLIMVSLFCLPQSAWAQTRPLIEDNEKIIKLFIAALYVDFDFIPIGQLDDNSNYGICIIKIGSSAEEEEEDRSRVPSLYVACEKNSNETDVYLVSVLNGLPVMNIGLKYEGVEMRCEIAGEDKIHYADTDIFTRTEELKTAGLNLVKVYKESYSKYEDAFKMLPMISKTYRENGGGRSMVRMTYGKTTWEKINDKIREEDEADRKAEQQKKPQRKKISKPKLDKYGCIAYVNSPNIARVVSKRIEPCASGYQWTCKVKNISSTEAVKSCFVEVKHYNKKGIELDSDLSSVDRIEPGQSRIISGRTRLTPKQRKSVKRTEFHVNVYTY